MLTQYACVTRLGTSHAAASCMFGDVSTMLPGLGLVVHLHAQPFVFDHLPLAVPFGRILKSRI